MTFNLLVVKNDQGAYGTGAGNIDVIYVYTYIVPRCLSVGSEGLFVDSVGKKEDYLWLILMVNEMISS